MLLSTAFCPPIEYFALLAKYSVLYLEACETYPKQTWRNRCRILTAGGVQDVTVPVVHDKPSTVLDVRVEYTTPWVPKFEKALDSAYGESPFFEFYRPGLYGILDAEPERLWDLNLQIIFWLCERFGINPKIVPTGEYTPAGSIASEEDYRELIHPKKPNTILEDMGLGKPYWQVFGTRFGFTPGLSALDLLFCQGPDSILYLR